MNHEETKQLPVFGQVTVQGQAVEVKQAREIDLVFVFDTTGSMINKIEALLSTCDDLVTELDRKQLRWQAGIVAFGDLTVPGDTIKQTGMTNRLSVFKEMLHKIPRNSGGANDGESSLEAIQSGIKLLRKQGQSVRVFVVITDEPALGSERVPQVTQMLKQEEVLTFCITPDLPYFRKMAKITGGVWLEIKANTTFSKIKSILFGIAIQIATIVDKVYQPTLGSGSVKRYLELTSGDPK